MRPPDPRRAAAPAEPTGADGQCAAGGDTDKANGTTPGYVHDATRCVTCSGVQHRDVIADLWWSWGGPYREVVAA